MYNHNQTPTHVVLYNVTNNPTINARTGSRVERENEASENEIPTLDNPTWGYLYNNFTKTELQRHCRSLGIKKIWLKKDELADKIVQYHQTIRTNQVERTEENETLDPIERIKFEMKEIR